MISLNGNKIKVISKCGENTDFTDHHSGFNTIESGERVVITENKQMINYDGLSIDDDLVINGDLILN